MNRNFLEKLTKVSYISLATLPLLKENINSIFIILCALLVLVNVLKMETKPSYSKEIWGFTGLFWIFLLHEILSQDFNFDRILLHVPFLVIPLIFFYKPAYINQKTQRASIKVFQISAILQCFIYFFIFILKHPLDQLFSVRNNIPFFREYVSENYFFEIHPTYFSAYLLVSFTISFFALVKGKKLKALNVLNSITTLFFIVLFSSRIIFIILILTVIVMVIYVLKRNTVKNAVFVLGGLTLVLFTIFYPSKNGIVKRFNEIKTEINKPIIGDYYNSTNTRMAILKCSLLLIEDVPFFGYGDELQNRLNDCYKENNKSDFYLKQTFNTHNYYFNMIAYGGWAFFLLFLLFIIFIFKKISHSFLCLVILIQFMFINITENYFSRHYGIVFFIYMVSLFYFLNSKNQPKPND